jgi:hypothetical protein
MPLGCLRVKYRVYGATGDNVGFWEFLAAVTPFLGESLAEKQLVMTHDPRCWNLES